MFEGRLEELEEIEHDPEISSVADINEDNDQQSDEISTRHDIEGSNYQAGLTKEINKGILIDAFKRYQRGEPGSEDLLLEKVNEFAFQKLSWLDGSRAAGFSGVPTPDTADDWAQEACIAVWQALANGSFRGETPEAFYAFVNSITHNKKQDFKKSLIEAKRTRVPLMVTVDDTEDGGDSDSLQENPEVHRQEVVDSVASVTIPASVQGIDRLICKFILAGYNYKKIAWVFGKSESWVKMRLQRLRKRLSAERKK